MRIVYADPGLCGHGGHHFNACRQFLSELRDRRIDTAVLAFHDLDTDVRQSTGATPLFRYSPYWVTDQDPLCGPAFAFLEGAKTLHEDFARNADVRADDIIYLPWASAAQLLGVTRWLDGLPQDGRPKVYANFLHVPDVTYEEQAGESILGLPDYRIEPSAMFLRLTAKYISGAVRARLRLGYCTSEGATILSAILGLEVEQLPSPQQAHRPLRKRTNEQPLTIGFIGHQRGLAKGVPFIPHIIAEVLRSHPNVHFVVHSGGSDLLPDVRQTMAAMAAHDRRIIFREGSASEAEWYELLDMTDLIVCPYHRFEYRLSTSGVHNEAIANGIPSVVPSDTTLSRSSELYPGSAVTFGPGEPNSIVQAVRTAIGHFDEMALAAYRAAERWSQINGSAKLVDAILRPAATSHPHASDRLRWAHRLRKG